MTSIATCSGCGGEFRIYENGDGTSYGRCYNCGRSYTFGPAPKEAPKAPRQYAVVWMDGAGGGERIFDTLAEARDFRKAIRPTCDWTSIEGVDA